MRRNHRTAARVIAYAMPQDQHRKQTLWAVAAGLLTSVAIYVVASLLT